MTDVNLFNKNEKIYTATKYCFTALFGYTSVIILKISY